MRPAAEVQPTTAAARTVLTVVVDQQGRPVVDLGVDDFVVTEGGTPHEVLDVHVADYPLALVVDDRAGQAGFDPARVAARRFIERVGERPIALFRLTDGGHPLTSLDDDRATVVDRLGSMAPATTTLTPPLDTIAAAAKTLKDTGAPFSAVVMVAAGPVDATALVRGELLPQILDSGAAVHVVQTRGTAPAAAADSPADVDLLRVVADQSRGQFTTIYSSASFPAALDRLADRLAIELMVQYLVPEGPRSGDVKVGVRLPGARAVGMGVK